jgi:hypothetical protein
VGVAECVGVGECVGVAECVGVGECVGVAECVGVGECVGAAESGVVAWRLRADAAVLERLDRADPDDGMDVDAGTVAAAEGCGLLEEDA